MPSLWRWEPNLRRYRNAETGRFIGAKGMVDLRDTFVARQKAQTADLAARLTGGELDTAQWVTQMRQVVKQTYIDEYVMARGGRAQLTQADYGRLGAMLKEQYKYLQGFERDILSGKLTSGQIATRAGMYIDSATQAFERAQAVAVGAPSLPQYPGDGATVCRCITSGESRVLTMRGHVPLLDVRLGDYVLTHRGRFRKVTSLVIKPSESYHEQYWLRAPGGGWVGCTNTHRWLSIDGWKDSSDICNYAIVYYNPFHEELQSMPKMRDTSQQSFQANAVQDVSIGMSLRQLQRLSGGRVSVMRQVAQGAATVAGSTRDDNSRYSAGWHRATATLRRFVRRYEVAGQARWARLRVLLDGGRQETLHLSLSMALATSERPDTEGLYDSSQGPQSNERLSGELGTATLAVTRPLTRRTGACKSRVAESKQNMSSLWQRVHGRTTEGPTADVLFAGLLPQGTTLYDIEVEEDHSYIIEGLVSHNTNCKCHWEIRSRPGGWDCFWRLGPVKTEHCPDCQVNAQTWNPLLVEDRA